MNLALVVGLALLPVAMYAFAWLLASCREWLGITQTPRSPRLRAVSLARAMRRGNGRTPHTPSHV
jgi:hypothetical protein